MRLHRLVLLLVSQSHALPLATSFQPGAPVTTTSGIITGTSSTLSPDISAYLGIPFALPPVGANRFAPPIRFTNTSTSISATRFGPDCPGTLVLPGAGSVDEDCLTLNIWAPPPSTDGAPKAVMLWIYGGAFVGGSSAMGMTDGTFLAKNGDVIVVAVNYRLSIFGFPGAPGLEQQNLGLLDQRAGVEWVRDNIKAFGGDPEKIVLFGQSAGADSVDMYTYAWTKDPIVKGFIGESGGSTMCGLVGNVSYQSWFKIAGRLGCGDAYSQVECMRTKPTDELVTAAKGLEGGFPPAFVPMPDGKVVFADYPDRMDKGLFIRAPFVIGNNDKEVGTSRQMNDQEFVCPAMQVADSRRKYGVPAWRYRFYGGTGGAEQSLLTSPIHASELTYVFGTMGTAADGAQAGILAALIPQPSAQKTAVSREFQAVWSAFAKDPVNGPTKLGWPLYNPDGNTLIRLAFGDERQSSLAKSNEYDGQCLNIQCVYSGFGGTGITLGAIGGLFDGPTV